MTARRRAIGRPLERGAGLIENMMALSIFSAGMVAVMSLTNELQYTNEIANEKATATTLARNFFEDIRTRDPEERAALGIDAEGTLGPLNGAGNLIPSGRYLIEWKIYDETPHDGLEMVTIFVSWTDPRGHVHREHFHSGLRRGWPLPEVIDATVSDHGHGRGHDPKTNKNGD